MKRIRNKNDLLAWLEQNAPRKAIANAMIDGNIELLGFFNLTPGSTNHGWIIRVTSKRKLTWNVAIVVNIYTHNYFTYTIKEVHWENYIGGDIPLFAGDNPEIYKRLKNENLY